MDRYCDNDWRAVPLMRERIVKSGSIGSGNTCMCAALCGAHYGNRSFFTVGGWCETFMYTVFCMRNIGIFPDGVLRNHTGWNGCLDINIRIITCGVAYTLQIIGQNGLNPTLASMIMSLESVFSVLTGWLILDEQLGGREIMGCVLIFAAILLAQVPVGKKIKS